MKMDIKILNEILQQLETDIPAEVERIRGMPQRKISHLFLLEKHRNTDLYNKYISVRKQKKEADKVELDIQRKLKELSIKEKKDKFEKRKQIILGYLSQGMSAVSISKILNIQPKIIYRIIHSNK